MTVDNSIEAAIKKIIKNKAWQIFKDIELTVKMNECFRELKKHCMILESISRLK